MTKKQTRHIPAKEKYRLFSSSAGYCQNPDCLCELYPKEMGGQKHIAEMAHVIPYGKGPRDEQRPEGGFDVNSADNLILLCPTCHTVVDKNDSAYPRSILLGWKENHLSSLAAKNGIIRYSLRLDAREAIHGLMEENKAVWRLYAPCDGIYFEYDPESTTASIWGQRVRSVILPNLYRIQSIVEMNTHLFKEGESIIFGELKEHIKTLTDRHVVEKPGGVARYPKGMNGLFL